MFGRPSVILVYHLCHLIEVNIFRKDKMEKEKTWTEISSFLGVDGEFMLVINKELHFPLVFFFLSDPVAILL